MAVWNAIAATLLCKVWHFKSCLINSKDITTYHAMNSVCKDKILRYGVHSVVRNNYNTLYCGDMGKGREKIKHLISMERAKKAFRQYYERYVIQVKYLSGHQDQTSNNDVTMVLRL